MSRYLSQIRTEVKLLVRDQSMIIQEADYNSAINLALGFYSVAHPYRKSATLAGDGATYQITLPSDFDPDFSTIVEVRFPADESDEREPDLLEPDEGYDVIQTATGTWVLRLLNDTPSTGETLRYIYTTQHAITESTTTLPGGFAEQRVIFAAAAFCCDQLSAYYTQSTDSTISADSVNFNMKGSDYAGMAKRYRTASGLQRIIEAGGNAEPVACITREFDVPPSYGQHEDYIVHSKSRR